MRRTEMWRATRLVVAALVALAALAACGSDDDTAEGSEDGDRAEQQEGYPVTIEHAAGETTIEQRPERADRHPQPAVDRRPARPGRAAGRLCARPGEPGDRALPLAGGPA